MLPISQRVHNENSRVRTLFTLLIAFAGPPLLFVIVAQRVFGPAAAIGIQVVLQLLYFGLFFLVLWIVRTQEQLPLTSIGIRTPDWTTVVSGVVVAAASLFVLPLMTVRLQRVLNAEVEVRGTVQLLASLPVWFRLVLGITGGIVEETLYRGYGVERLASMTGNLWLAAMISVVAFTLAHIPTWGWRFALAADLPFAILMTAFYLWKRDLIANMIAHASALVVGLISI